MKRLKRILGMRGLLGWFTAGILSLAIASLFVLVYNYSGTHITNPSEATDYKWMPAQYKAVWGEGINYMRMDDNGFNNLSSDTDGIDLLLMGGSHMEAVQFGTKYNAGSCLNNLLDLKTYNVGMSGHQLVNCLDNLEAAVAAYRPSAYVVIQTSSLDVTMDEVKAVHDGTLADIPSYDSGIVYQLQKIPALKVIYKQLSDKLAIDRAGVAAGKAEDAIAAEGYDEDAGRMEKLQVMAEVLEEKAALCADNGIRLVLAYTPGVSVDSAGTIYRNDNEEWAGTVEKAAADAGIIMVDCYEAFKDEYENSCALPFGFHNAAMGSGHLNKTGHRIVAQEIAEAVKDTAGEVPE